MMKCNILLLLFSTVLLIAISCNEPKESVEKEDIQAITVTTVETDNLFSTYFNKDVQEAVAVIKASFEKGISRDFDFPRIGEAYEYNSTTLRADIFNKIPFTLTFPYDGTFKLEDFEQYVKQIPFLTNKCGFQDAKANKIIHYYCMNLNEHFFEYLSVLGKENSFIESFRVDYLKSKSISPNVKQQMTLRALEELDLDNYDHQLIYMFLHIGVNEERMAVDKINK